MTNVPQLTPPPTDPPQPAAESGRGLQRTLVIAVGGFFGLLILLFGIGVVLAAIGDVESTASTVRLIRDLVIIVLALEGALIVMGLAVLIVQVARLIALVQTEIKPIIENTQETLKTARGTVEFMSNNLTQPVIRTSGFFAAFGIFINNLFGLRRAVRRADKANAEEPTNAAS